RLEVVLGEARGVAELVAAGDLGEVQAVHRLTSVRGSDRITCMIRTSCTDRRGASRGPEPDAVEMPRGTVAYRGPRLEQAASRDEPREGDGRRPVLHGHGRHRAARRRALRGAAVARR